MRLPDANCAYAREQLKKLQTFNITRAHNYHHLKCRLLKADLPIIIPSIPKKSSPAYFGFPIVLDTIRTKKWRDDLVNHLESNGIRTRLFFAGNILRHPPYKAKYGVLCEYFSNADYLMKNGLFLGCWHGLTTDDMDYIADKLITFFRCLK
jgi:CDP-6-deoxy-D-xylo-4-hexulose-3-dehydrase